MKEICLKTKTQNTKIYFGNDVFDKNGAFSSYVYGSKNFVLTDKNVFSLYEDFFKENFSTAEIFVLPSGEEQKSFDVAKTVLKKMSDCGLDRKSCLFAVGGGVIGDLGGFCASVYMRGISLIMIPTTLLSQIDSSVGGKTAVDFCGYKKSIGTFYSADAVFVSPNFLKTLPEREMKSGLGEMVKYALLDKKVYRSFKKCDAIDFDFTVSQIFECIKYKVSVVKKDENDLKERRRLNLGHTTAHALELFYSMSHGESVLWGLYTELEVFKTVKEVKNKDKLFEYSAFVETFLDKEQKFENVEIALKNARKDKKNENNKIGLINPNKKTFETVYFSEEDYVSKAIGILKEW